MGDISRRITRKSLKAKRKAAIKTIKVQAKEKIHQIKVDYSMDAEKKKQKAAEKEHKKELRAQKANARLSYNARQLRPFTLGEDILSSITNGIGAGLSVTAIVLLVIRAAFLSPEPHRIVYVSSFAVFGASLFILHLVSTLYHAISSLAARKVFSVFNHCAIYLFIGGLYTPFLLICLSGAASTTGCAAVWTVCALLIALYAVLGERLHTFAVFTYVAFAVVFAAAVFSGNVPVKMPCSALLFSGAAVYAVSLILFLMRNYKWTHSIFHLFSLGGAVLMFFSVYYLV